MHDVELTRRDVSPLLDPKQRVELGQYLTPSNVASFMASMFTMSDVDVRLLDPGAGVGSLTAAFVNELCSRPNRPNRLQCTAYELDQTLLPHLRRTMHTCVARCRAAGVDCTFRVIGEDFIESGTRQLGKGLFRGEGGPAYNCAILNPPYRKIRSDSHVRRLLRGIGIETSNLYAAFVGVTLELLEASGELVAITPRSFCNGPYFRPFRRLLLREMAIRRLHIFDSRDRAFRDDEVLQENLILHAVRGGAKRSVTISSSTGPDDPAIQHRVSYKSLVDPNDRDGFIHIVTARPAGNAASLARGLSCSLDDLGISVSTGRVVDFRVKEFLLKNAVGSFAPLIYPAHLRDGLVSWPKPNARKPNAIAKSEATRGLLVPNGNYVLVRRFSAKEEPRRVVAAVFDPRRIDCDEVGFENHLNYFHRRGRGLPADLAKGLSAFLNSTAVDAYFRQFSGHTQVNATDLRRLRYPSADALSRLAKLTGDSPLDQARLDRAFHEAMKHEPRPSRYRRA